jgi:hypothetical protein
MYSLLDIISMIKSSWTECIRHVASMREMTIAYKALGGRPNEDTET